jgi:hypothetical protein
MGIVPVFSRSAGLPLVLAQIQKNRFSHRECAFIMKLEKTIMLIDLNSSKAYNTAQVTFLKNNSFIHDEH